MGKDTFCLVHLVHVLYLYIYLFLLLPLGALGTRETLVSLQFLNFRQSVELFGWGISPSQGHYLTQTQNKRRQPSMPWVGFELTITAFERAKTFHALDCTATVIGQFMYRVYEMSHSLFR
jgi:hypothetical protein